MYFCILKQTTSLNNEHPSLPLSKKGNVVMYVFRKSIWQQHLKANVSHG